jgi:hypothetical protein
MIIKNEPKVEASTSVSVPGAEPQPASGEYETTFAVEIESEEAEEITEVPESVLSCSGASEVHIKMYIEPEPEAEENTPVPVPAPKKGTWDTCWEARPTPAKRAESEEKPEQTSGLSLCNLC